MVKTQLLHPSFTHIQVLFT